VADKYVFPSQFVRIFLFSSVHVVFSVLLVMQQSGGQSGGQVATIMRKHNEVSVYWKPSRNGWYYRVQMDGRRVEKATGVSINSKAGKMAAEAKAKRIAEGLRTGSQEELAKVVRRPGYATAGEIVDRFKQHAPAGSATKAASGFAKYVAEASGRADWRAVSSHSVLTAPVLRLWITERLRAGRTDAGVRSSVQTVKQVVAQRRMHLFADMTLPDLTEFWKVSGGKMQDQSYEPIARDILRRMDAAARCPLRRENPRVWAIYWLMRRAGLRNSEVAKLRWEWVDWLPGGGVDLVLTKRPDFTSKNGKYGRVPVNGRLMRLIAATLGKGEYVIPRAHKTEAEDLTHDGVNAFVRRFIPDGAKGAYNLRKEFGSRIAQRDGLEVAAKLLRDSMDVVEKHYHALLERPKPL
jgi:integrase